MIDTGCAVANCASLALVLWRGEFWVALGLFPLILLQVIKCALWGMIDFGLDCSGDNKALSFVSVIIVASIPTVWMLWATRSISEEHKWVMLLVEEVTEEIRDQEAERDGKAHTGDEQEQGAQDAPHDIESGSGGLQVQIKGLSMLLGRRRQMWAAGLEKGMRFYNFVFAVYLLFATLGFSAGWLDMCTRVGPSGNQVWPALQGPRDSGVLFSVVRWTLPLIFTMMAFAAVSSYKGEFRSGRDHRLGWTCQFGLAMFGLVAVPVLWLFYGVEALPLWITLNVNACFFLALEPYISKFMTRRLRAVARSDKALAVFDEREAATKVKESWAKMFRQGLFLEGPHVAQGGCASSGCGCGPPVRVETPVRPERMSVKELTALMDARESGETVKAPTKALV